MKRKSVDRLKKFMHISEKNFSKVSLLFQRRFKTKDMKLYRSARSVTAEQNRASSMDVRWVLFKAGKQYKKRTALLTNIGEKV